jgi:hypothetical protein
MLRAVDPAVAYVVVYLRAAGDGWPADVGDDPAFECSRQRAHAGAQLSWGVCRPDLRNTITTGDVVVFIAADRLSDRPSARYKLAGWATAERAVSQLDVWQHEELAVYRHYRNLLIRPADDGSGFVHHETQHPEHPDWLWRLARHTRRGPPKAEWMTAGALRGIPANGVFHVGRCRERVAPNYVLFSADPDETVILADPPTVAVATTPGRLETWIGDPFAVCLRALLLGQVTGRGLRTTNRQQPHRHIRLDNPVLLRGHLHQLIKEHRLAARQDPER